MLLRYLPMLCCVALSGRALAAPPAAASPSVIQADVDLEKLDSEADLPWSDDGPLGLAVTQSAAAYWTEIGCKPGDVIVRIDNDPVSTMQTGIKEGLHTLDIVRRGKPILLRVLVHGPQFRTEHITVEDFGKLQDGLKDLGPGELALKRSRGLQFVQYNLRPDLALLAGDLIRTIGGMPIETEADLIAALKGMPVGHTDVSLVRDGRTITVTWEREP